jgi:branched-chain amino acid aminotransferase
MTDYLLYNGSFHKNSDALVTANNRGLRYGDGLFETFRVTGSDIHFGDWHFERLFSGMKLLQFDMPGHFTTEYLAAQVATLCKKNRHAHARIRINITRGDGGLYDPENHLPNCIIQSWELPAGGFHLNENGLVTGIYKDARKTTDAFCNIKSNNYLPYTMGALHAKRNKWNDAFILNTTGRVCDATIANVFTVKDGVIYTCPLTEGCVAGITRKYLLQNLAKNGFVVKEQDMTVDDLLAADEIFLTNSIKGIRWVSYCEDNAYKNEITAQVFSKLLKSLS